MNQVSEIPAAASALSRQSSSAEPRFSLVVPTIGRPDAMRALFDSLLAQTCQDFEVIVVDQSGKPDTANLIEQYQGRLTLTHIPMTVRGASRARNAGIDRARGVIIGFPDDDCTLPPHYLAEVSARFAARPELSGIATSALFINKFDPESGHIDRHNLFFRFCEPTIYLLRNKLGEMRFLNELGVGAGTPWGADEGAELLLRTLESGFQWHYYSDLVVWHPDPNKELNAKAFQRSYSYSCGRGYVMKRFRYPWYVSFKYPARCLAGAVLMLCTARWKRARFYANAFAGFLRGYFSQGPQN